MTHQTWTTWACCGEYEQFQSQEEAFAHAYYLEDADVSAHTVEVIEGPDGTDLMGGEAWNTYVREQDHRAKERHKLVQKTKPVGYIEIQANGRVYRDAAYTEEALVAEYARNVDIYGEDRVEKVLTE